MQINSAKDLDVYKKAYFLAMKVFELSCEARSKEQRAESREQKRERRGKGKERTLTMEQKANRL